MSLPVIVVALDLGNIFHFILSNTGVDTRCRGVVIVALFLSAPSALRTSLLVVLVLFWVGGRSLLSRKELFSTRRISRGGVGRPILSTGVFLLLHNGPVPFGTPQVHVVSIGRGLEHCLCLCIDGFFHGLFLRVQVTDLGIQLGPDRRFQAF